MPYVKAMLQAAEPKPEYDDKESHLPLVERTTPDHHVFFGFGTGVVTPF